jgi:hypothetical protein
MNLFAVSVGEGFLDLRPDLRNAAIDFGPGAVDDRDILLFDQHFLGTTAHVALTRNIGLGFGSVSDLAALS